MANIKVPITILKKDKFNFPISKPEFTKADTTASEKPLGDLQFLRQLSEQGRLITENGTDDDTALAVISVTPASGDTFFFTSAFFAHTSGDAEYTVDLVKAGQIVDTIITAGNVVGDGAFHLQFDRLVGNGLDTFQINYTKVGLGAADVSVTMNGYLENTKTQK